MADKVVTYTDPTVSDVCEVHLYFNKATGAVTSGTVQVCVRSNSTSGGLELGDRMMHGSLDVAGLTASEQSAIDALKTAVLEDFRTDEGF